MSPLAHSGLLASLLFAFAASAVACDASDGSRKQTAVLLALYDMTHPTPRVLTDTWGGANSLQVYGPEGGADRVTEVGQPGVTLLLERPLCARS
jgi:hypothetical protein